MPIIQLIYANAREDNRLEHLPDEKAAVGDRLWEWQHDERSPNRLYQDESTELSVFLNKLGQVEMQKGMIVLGFSGHAYSDKLIFNDDHARGEIIAKLLGHFPNLKLILLNGCATNGHLKHLEEAGFPLIITTNNSVGDERAKNFADALFHQLGQGRTIKDSFEWACGQVNAGMEQDEITSLVHNRSVGRREEDEKVEVTQWELSYADASDLEWCLDVNKENKTNTEMTLARLKKDVQGKLMDDRLEEALLLLNNHIKEDAYSFNTIIGQQGRLKRLNRERDGERMRNDDYMIGLSRIRFAISNMMDDIEEDEVINYNSTIL